MSTPSTTMSTEAERAMVSRLRRVALYWRKKKTTPVRMTTTPAILAKTPMVSMGKQKQSMPRAAKAMPRMMRLSLELLNIVLNSIFNCRLSILVLLCGGLLGAGGGGEGGAHVGVGLDVLHAVVVHDAEVAAAEGFGHGQGHFGFGHDDLGAGFLGLGFHLLLGGHSHGAALLGLGLGDVLVGVGLVHLELGADVLAHVDVGDVDGEDFEGGAAVEALGEDEFGDAVGVLEHLLVAGGAADGGDDAFAHAGEDGLLAGAADELLDVGAHGDTGFGDELDAVLGHGGHGGRVDDLGVDGGLHGLQHVAAGEVDGRGGLEVEVHVGLVGADEGVDHGGHMAAGQVVGLEVVLLDLQAGLGGRNHVVDNHRGRHFAEAHEDELHKVDVHAGDDGLEPDAYGHQIEEDDHRDDDHSDEDHCTNCHDLIVFRVFFETVVVGLAHVDAVAFDGYDFDFVVGVDEFVDGVDLHGLAVDEGFAGGGEARDGDAAGAGLHGGLQLVHLAVALLLEAEAVPGLGFEYPQERQQAEHEGAEQDDGAHGGAQEHVALPYAEGYGGHADGAGNAAGKYEHFEGQQDDAYNEDDDDKQFRIRHWFAHPFSTALFLD